MKKEIWKRLYDWPYEVSNQGRIRFLKTKRILKSHRKDTYARVTLYFLGLKFTTSVHQLVYEVFFGTIPAGLQIAHLNGIANDNRAENLKAVSCVENQQHKKDHGTHREGEQIPSAKLNREKVLKIKTLLKNGIAQRVIAEQMGVKRETIKDIKLQRTWKHIT